MIGKYIAKYKWLLVGIITVIIVARRHITINLCPPFVPWFARILENLGFVVIAAIAIFIIFNLIGNFILKLQRREEEYENISNQVKRVNEQMSEKAKVLAQKIDESATLQRIVRAINQTMDVDKILNVILESICKYLSYDKAIVFLINEKHGNLEVRHSVGVEPEKVKDIKISLDKKENFIVRTILEKLPHIVKRSSLTNGVLASIYNPAEFVPNTIASVPIEAKDRIIGALVVDNVKSKRPIEEKDLRALVTFTSQAGLAIENARLYETEKNFTEELKKQVNQAVEKLQKAQKQLVQSEKLSALGQMATVVTHEVRNPLSTIRGSAEIISNRIKSNDPSRKFVEYIIQEVDRLNRIVTDILTFSRQSQAFFSKQDINKLINQVLDFLDASYFVQLKCTAKRDLAKNLPLVAIDADLIKQVLLNVIQNACYFMEKRAVRRLNIKSYQKDQSVVIEIEDTGPGIPPENLDKIFEPFFTTRAKGTGLGLSISKNIIESHKGKIEVKSELGIGSAFYIRLPIKKMEGLSDEESTNS